MKKALLLLVVFIVMLSAGCGQVDSTDGVVETTRASSESNTFNQTETDNLISNVNNQNTEDKNSIRADYPNIYPSFSISCGQIEIPWIRGKANFCANQEVIMGNTNFGASAFEANEYWFKIKTYGE